MKNKLNFWKTTIAILVLTILMTITMVACGSASLDKVDNNTNSSMFVEIEKVPGIWRVVYHKDTKVMYTVSIFGEFAVMYNANGTIMTYKGK